MKAISLNSPFYRSPQRKVLGIPPGKGIISERSNMPSNHQLATRFLNLHTEPDVRPFILPNPWDGASATIFERAGFSALGTTSHGIASSLGYPGGSYLDREQMVAAIRRIVRSVEVPVSADIESGYGDSPTEIAATVDAVIGAGAVGINIEDGTGDEDNPLRGSDRQIELIEAARDIADEHGLSLVINARTDVFVYDVGASETRSDRAIGRGNEYLDAGADCVFIPGVTDPSVIEALVDGIGGPINVIGKPGAPSVGELGDLGVVRVSLATGPFRAALTHVEAIGREVRYDGTYTTMAEAISAAEVDDRLLAAYRRWKSDD